MSLNQSADSTTRFSSPEYPSFLSESLNEDKSSLKINALLSTAKKLLVDPNDEKNASDVTAPAYIPDPRKPRVGAVLFDRHPDRFEDTREAQNHTVVVERSIMDDRNVFDADDKRPFVSKGSRSEALHWSPRFLKRRPQLTAKQLHENCTMQTPGHDSEPADRQVLRTAPNVGFTQAKRFMTKSDPRSYLAHASGAPASTRPHADPAKYASPGCGNFSTRSAPRRLFEFRFMAGCASPGYKYDVHTRSVSQNVAAPAFSFPSVLRFDASRRDLNQTTKKSDKKFKNRKKISMHHSPDVGRFKSPAGAPMLDSMF